MVWRWAGWLGRLLAGLVILISLTIVMLPPFLDRIYYEGLESGHFDGERFFNPDQQYPLRLPGGNRNRGDFFLRMILGEGRPPWPDQVPVTPVRPADRIAGDRMVVHWVGHSTVLIQTQGLNILTDPIWSERAGPFGRSGPKRVAAPGVRFDDLPKIDLVLVSHNHYDHLDQPTLKRLWDRDRPLIVTSLGNDMIIRAAGNIPSRALEWGHRLTVKPGVDVIATRNHHWSSRWFTDRNRALWSSFVVTTPAGNIFFAGDTGAGDMRWPSEAARYGPIRFAMLPIGAFRFAPGEMTTDSHIGPYEAVAIYRKLGAAHALAIHWGTFRLSFEARNTPPYLLKRALRQAGISPDRFRARPFGVAWDIPLLDHRIVQ